MAYRKKSIDAHRLFYLLIGGAALTLVTTLFVVLIYNSIFYQSNSYLLSKYGLPRDLSKILLAIILLSAFSIVFNVLSFFFYLGNGFVFLRLLFLILGGIAFALMFIGQLFGVIKSTYGESIIANSYNYYEEKDDFKDYVDQTYGVGNKSMSLPYNSAILQYDASKFKDFIVNYVYVDKSTNYVNGAVPSCQFNFAHAVLNGSDPCNYNFEKVTGRCIGGWTPKKFQKYWCHLSKTQDKVNKAYDTQEKITIQAKEIRDYKGLKSVSAFFIINTILIIFESVSILLLFITMVIQLIFNYKEIKAIKLEMLNKKDDNDNLDFFDDTPKKDSNQNNNNNNQAPLPQKQQQPQPQQQQQQPQKQQPQQQQPAEEEEIIEEEIIEEEIIEEEEEVGEE